MVGLAEYHKNFTSLGGKCLQRNWPAGVLKNTFAEEIREVYSDSSLKYFSFLRRQHVVWSGGVF